jgi:hypothetical protein
VVAGIWHPACGVVGGAAEMSFFCRVLLRQLRAGGRGRGLFAYSLFASWALAVLVVAALRL